MGFNIFSTGLNCTVSKTVNEWVISKQMLIQIFLIYISDLNYYNYLKNSHRINNELKIYRFQSLTIQLSFFLYSFNKF